MDENFAMREWPRLKQYLAMSTFHRPKVYRSTRGCCICKAKSSSSRFTDSKKYEEEFLECFKLSTPRQGEICNACVLLVKRWKKLPAGSDRHWQHVVDARAGPGMKSMSKFKLKKRAMKELKNSKAQKKFEKESSPQLSEKSEGNEEMELGEVDFLSEDLRSRESSRTASPGASDFEEVVERSRRFKSQARHRDEISRVSDFVDTDYWKKETICCGVIFRGLYNEVMIDPSYIKPCSSRLASCKLQSNGNKSLKGSADNTTSKMDSDSSSDSGYDESSNSGMSADNAFKKDHVGFEEINSRIPAVN
ncbi:SIN3-HDAC complex-associated factor isoform X2 [Leptinotarsa decemlineata]|uniref:SIN3-HDAC complex-associated factor isoform X2 n=1 Tax=Leptinotarsa decemlineata TaxID=7539 RepID=UPI003D306F4F